MSNADLESRIVATYNCPSCKHPILPPRHCFDGHLFCVDCGGHADCESCRDIRVSGESSIRNLAMENAARLLSFACKYCTRSFPYPGIRAHRETCQNLLPCLYADTCGWHGHFREAVDHLLTSHGDSVSAAQQVQDVFDDLAITTSPDPGDQPLTASVMKCLEHEFLFAVGKRDSSIHVAVFLIGRSEEAAEFNYSLILTPYKRRHQCIVFNGLVRSIRVLKARFYGDDMLVHVSDHLVLNEEQVKKYADAQHHLSFRVQIIPVTEC